MKVRLAVAFAIVGLLLPALAQAQNVRTFGAQQAYDNSLGLHHQ